MAIFDLKKITKKINPQKISFGLLWLYLFLIPIQTAFIFDERIIGEFKWHYGSGLIYLNELILWLAGLLFFSYWLFKKIQTAGNLNKTAFRLWRDHKKNISLFLLFLIPLLVSLITATEKSAHCYLMIKIFDGLLLLILLRLNRFTWSQIAWPILLSSATQGFFAGWQFLHQTINSFKWLGIANHQAGTLGEIVIETSAGRWLRSYGTLPHPNILGGFCSLGLLFGWALKIKNYDGAINDSVINKKTGEKILPYFLSTLILLSSLGVFFSFSKSAVLGLIGGSVILILLNKKIVGIKKSLLPITPTIIILVIFCAIFGPLITTRLDTNSRLEQKSATERINQYQQAKEILKQRPISGTGLNNYALYLWQQNPDQPIFMYQPIHNIYILILCELGLLSLLWLAIIINFGKNIKLDSASIEPIGVSILCAIMIIALFDHYFWTQAIGQSLLWLGLTFYFSGFKMKNNAL